MFLTTSKVELTHSPFRAAAPPPHAQGGVDRDECSEKQNNPLGKRGVFRERTANVATS